MQHLIYGEITPSLTDIDANFTELYSAFSPTPKSYGALGNNVADDSGAFTRGAWWVTDGTYRIVATSVSLGANASIAGPKTAVLRTDAQLFGVQLNTGSELRDLTVTTTGGINVNLLASTRGQAVIGATLTNTSTANSTAVNVNTAPVRSVRVSNNDISARSFGVLTNSVASVDGLVVSGNIIEATEGDAIEINGPVSSGHVHSTIAITGNVLRAGASGSGSATGFAMGLAGGRNVAVVGNAIANSRLAPFHYEEAQRNNTVVGNVALNCSGPGLWVQQTAGGTSAGLVFSGNALEAAAASTNPGILCTYDATGSVPGMALIGNRLRGFAVGIQAGSEDIICANNVVEASPAALGVVANGKVDLIGRTMARDCPTLLTTVAPTMVGKIHSNIQPTRIVDTTGKPAGMGATLQGFAFPVAGATFARASITGLNLFKMPTRLFGRVILRLFLASSNNYSYASATVKYDGLVLTVTDLIKDTAGLVDITAFTLVGGQLSASITNASPTVDFTAGKVFVDFDGEYYQT